MKFRKEIKWEPGFDYRNDPDKKQYGCHGLQIRFLLHGEKATIQLLIYTGWLPTWEHFKNDNQVLVLPADLGYHADNPQYEGQSKMDDCEYRKQSYCYYDGSGLQAYDVFKLLVTSGEKAVWKRMIEEYNSRFLSDKE